MLFEGENPSELLKKLENGKNYMQNIQGSIEEAKFLWEQIKEKN